MNFSNYFCGEDGYCLDYDKAKIAILPVPYDGTSTWIKGSDKGPKALIEASGAMEMYDIPTGTDVSKQGIFTMPAVTESCSPSKMVNAVEQAVSKLIADNKFPLLVGGEHSVSIGAFRAMAKEYKDLTILQFDAHADLRPSYEGSEYNHACALFKAREVADVVQIGIRSICEEEIEFIDSKRIFFREQVRSDKRWEESAIEQLSSDVYITIDLDVFDPSIMPSTGTPEPDGLLYHDVLSFINRVNSKHRIVGLDIVELCPNSADRAPDFLAAKLSYQILSLIFKK